MTVELGPQDDPLRDDIGWHALKYRSAHTVHAEAMWQELVACIDRKVAAEVLKERERCAALCDKISDEYQINEGSRHPERRSDAETGASKCAHSIRSPAAE